MKASKVYLKAAESLDAGRFNTAPYAVLQVDGADEAHNNFTDLFRTNEPNYDGLQGNDGVIALLLMHHIAADEERK